MGTKKKMAVAGLAAGIMLAGLLSTAVWAQEQKYDREKAKEYAAQLKDKEAEVRGHAAWALGLMQAKEYAKDIAKLLDDSTQYGSHMRRIPNHLPGDKDSFEVHNTVNEKAIRALAMMGAREYVKEIVKLLKHEDLEVREAAQVALQMWAPGWMQAKEYAPKVAELLKDGNAWVRGYAAVALGYMKAKEYAKEVAELLKDGDAVARAGAAQALGLMEAKEYAKDIAELLKDEDGEARGSAARVLKDWGYKVKEVEKGKWELEEEIKDSK